MGAGPWELAVGLEEGSGQCSSTAAALKSRGELLDLWKAKPSMGSFLNLMDNDISFLRKVFKKGCVPHRFLVCGRAPAINFLFVCFCF